MLQRTASEMPTAAGAVCDVEAEGGGTSRDRRTAKPYPQWMPARSAALLLQVLLGVGPTTEGASVPPAFPASAAYRQGLNGLRAGRAVSVEEVFRLATAAGKEIEADITKADEARVAGADAKPTLLELEGLAISWEEAIFAKPKPDFFLALARSHGRKQDRTFFELLLATKPDGVWPAYLEQETDVTGCVRFDLPELPSLYARWLAFRDSHPKAYQDDADRELLELDRWLKSDCSCGGRETVIEGLSAILRAAPKAPSSLDLKTRLDAVRNGEASLRFNCHSG